MSYKRRGSAPSNTHHGYYTYWRHYVPLDNTYVIMQMITTFILIICGIFSYLTFYKSSIVDPIQSIKSSFMNSYLLIIFSLLTITLLINFFSKNKIRLIKRLILTFILSIITMVTFCAIKLNMDSTYNYSKFEQISQQQQIDENSKSNKFSLGINGMNVKSEKEYYIDECVKLYNIFKTKTYVIVFMHLLLNILLGY